MHVVIRRYANAAAFAEKTQWLAGPLNHMIQEVPGIVAYYAARDGDVLTTVTVCLTSEGTQESTRIEQEWLQKLVADVSINAPEITEGETFYDYYRRLQ